MSKRKALQHELEQKTQSIIQKQEELKKYKSEKENEINNIAFNTLFPNTAMELLPSTPEIGSSSMLENSNLKENSNISTLENSKNCGNTLQSSTSESPRKSVVDPSEKAKLAAPIFTPQKPGSSHPLQSVLDYSVRTLKLTNIMFCSIPLLLEYMIHGQQLVKLLTVLKVQYTSLLRLKNKLLKNSMTTALKQPLLIQPKRLSLPLPPLQSLPVLVALGNLLLLLLQH